MAPPPDRPVDQVLVTLTPASALGSCAQKNRNIYGYCVWGGQNQNWCLQRTGRVAAYGPNGTRWCGR